MTTGRKQACLIFNEMRNLSCYKVIASMVDGGIFTVVCVEVEKLFWELTNLKGRYYSPCKKLNMF